MEAFLIKQRLPHWPRPENENMTRAEAAKYLRVSQAHVSNLVRGRVAGAPVLRCSWLGRRMIFKKSWLDEFVDASTNEVGR